MLRDAIGGGYAALLSLVISAGCMAGDASGQGAGPHAGTASAADSNLESPTAYAALAAGAPAPSVPPFLPGRAARTVLHEEVNEAENLCFTADGRLFVSGGEDIYEIERQPDGTFTKTDRFHEDCLVEGIVHSGAYLYGVCTLNGDDSLPARLIAGELSAEPVFRTIAPLDAGSAPNGMTIDPQGRIYITQWFANRILRVTLASPTAVARTEVWADGLSLANGIKYQDHALYVTLLDPTLISRFVRIPVQPDGSAGEPELLYARILAVFNDIIAFEDGFIITDFLKGTLIFWDARRGIYAETPAGTFYGPSALAQGQPPMFDERQLIVAEKGMFLVRDERDGDLLSKYQLP
jgi:hypothetical protein